MAARVSLSDDGKRLIFDGPIWQHSAPVEDLPRWLELHRRLRDRDAPRDKKTGRITDLGPYHRHHAPIVDQLEAIERELRRNRS